LSTPSADNPNRTLISEGKETCGVQPDGPVHFLPQFFGPFESLTDRLDTWSCEIPAGRSVYLNGAFAYVFGCSTCSGCRIVLNDLFQGTILPGLLMEVWIDGVPLEDLERFRTRTEGCDAFDLPADNVLGAPEGLAANVVTEGFPILVDLCPGDHVIEQRLVLGTLGVEARSIYELRVLSPQPFERGDPNEDRAVDLSDGLFVLNFLFSGGQRPGCLRSADVDDNGSIEVTDATSLFNYLFLGGDEPATPFADCGTDSSPDTLTCDSFPSCGS